MAPSAYVALLRSPTTRLPGVPFFVAATTNLIDEGATPITCVIVQVSLELLPKDYLACNKTCSPPAAAQRCRMVSGAPLVDVGNKACKITLPCASDFVLQACAVAFANGTAFSGGVDKEGRPSSTCVREIIRACAEQTWSSHDDITLFTDKEEYTLGSTATLAFVTPSYSGASRGVLFWGNAIRRLNKTVCRAPAARPQPDRGRTPWRGVPRRLQRGPCARCWPGGVGKARSPVPAQTHQSSNTVRPSRASHNECDNAVKHGP